MDDPIECNQRLLVVFVKTHYVWIPIFSSPQYLKRYNLDIYNRWGERVFETTDLNQGWDGTYQGSPVQDGTYTWKINFRWYDQRAFELTGHITLIK